MTIHVWLAIAVALLQRVETARIQPAAAVNRLTSSGHSGHHEASGSHVAGRAPHLSSWVSRQHKPFGINHVEQIHSNETSSLLHVEATSAAVDSQLRFSETLPSAHMFAGILDYDNVGKIFGLSPRSVRAIGLGFFMLLCGSCITSYFLQVSKCSDSRNRYVSKDQVVYEWDQTATTITMYLNMPGGLSKQHLDVLVWPKHIQIDRRGKHPFLKEELFASVNAEASTWSITRTNELQIRLAKVKEGVWPCVLLSHESCHKQFLPGGTKARKSFMCM